MPKRNGYLKFFRVWLSTTIPDVWSKDCHRSSRTNRRHYRLVARSYDRFYAVGESPRSHNARLYPLISSLRSGKLPSPSTMWLWLWIWRFVRRGGRETQVSVRNVFPSLLGCREKRFGILHVVDPTHSFSGMGVLRSS